MRYSRSALLLFGAGMLLGLVVVAAKLLYLARVSSGAMALGIVLLPVALVADWRRRKPKPKTKTKSKSTKRTTAPARRRRPPARR